MIHKVINSFKNLFKIKKLDEWFFVSFDDNGIYWKVKPLLKKSWTDNLSWEDIECVCFVAKDLYESDEIFIFTKNRSESYVVPTEANGGDKILPELIDRKLFCAELAIKASTSTGGMFCDPDLEEYIKSKKAS